MNIKRELIKNRTLFELTIILPAFYFLYLQLKSAQEKHLLKPQDILSREFIITDQIVRRLASVKRIVKICKYFSI